MSHHQSRADRSDSQQRRGARSGGGSAHQRTLAGKGSGGGGQGPSASAASFPSPATQPAPVPSSKRSGGINGQSRGLVSTNFDTSESQRAQQSTSSQQHAVQTGHGQPGVKTSNGTLTRSSRPGTPSSSSVSKEVIPVNPKPDTPWNTSVHPQLSFQFGSIGASISPGTGPYVQIPARTSSAPPNLDEQKQDLLRLQPISSHPVKAPIPSGQPQVPRSQVQQSGGQQLSHPSFRSQPQTAVAGVPQPSYHQQGQQHPMTVQGTQRSSHMQPSVGNTPGQLHMQPHLIASQPQQQGMVHLPYQHGLQAQMQHKGGQVMKYPQPMGGPPLMTPTLAPLPGQMQSTQITQMPHQLPGGLGSGIPAPYGVVPLPGPVIPPRTSSAVKITHPDTHEELKFDFKSAKRDSYFDGVVSATSAALQSSMVGNGPSQTRPSLGYGSGANPTANQNVYAAQQNGPFTSTQHFYQPTLPSSAALRNPTGAEASSVSKTSSVSMVNTSTSRDLTPGTSVAVTSRESTPVINVLSMPGPSNSVPQVVASVASEKQELSASISTLGTNDQAHESGADIDDKPVKVWPAENATVVAKDVLAGKEIKEEGVELISTKESHKSDSIAEVRQNNKKKKKKDGPMRASSTDISKASRVVAETKKQSDSKISEPQKVKVVTTKPADQVETSSKCTFDTVGKTPEAVDAINSAGQPESCNSELATGSHSTMSDVDVSFNYEVEKEIPRELTTKEVAILPNMSLLDVDVSANSVHKALAADADIGLVENTNNQIGLVSEEVHNESLANTSEPTSIDSGSSISHATQAVGSETVLEPQVSYPESLEDNSQSSFKEREEDSCEVEKAEISQSDQVSLAVKLEPESLSVDQVSKEVTALQSESEPVEFHSNVQVLVGLALPKDVSEDANVSAAPDVKPGSRKKKLKDILAKADAAGTGDLYNAYKAPEEKKMDEALCAKVGDSKSSGDDPVKQAATSDENVVPKEVDDWEDAVELPPPQATDPEKDDADKIAERQTMDVRGRVTYTRDFLLTLKDQNLELPLDFEFRQDINDLLMNRNADRDMLPGRLDRQLSGGPRRSNSSNTFDDDRWARGPQGLHSPTWPDGYADMGPPGGFRPGNAQGLIPRMAANSRPGLTVPPLVPGLIPGKTLTSGTSAGLFRTNTVESDRWQKMPTAQKGLIPSPQNPLPPVHKAEKRYEVGLASDEEEVKQRQIKGILNKLTPQNFQKLFEQVKDVNIQSAITLTGVISQIFDKALTEPTFCEMYATFCKRLATDMPEFIEDGDKVTFKRVLLNKCQEEFHRGEREQAEASLEGEDSDSISAEGREERRLTAKRRMLGNIRFIGELYKNHMLTERIMHECIRKLLGDYENPEEEDVEALCKLMSTIGYMIDQPATKEHIDAYLERITRLSNNQRLSARIRFMLKDLIDLRRNGWQERRKVEGPKRIDEVHRDAVQERQQTVVQAGRLSRGPSVGTSSGRRIAPPDISVRGPPSSMFSPPSNVRGVQTPGRAPLVQDVRMEDKLLMERSMPMPLSQRSVDEGPLTLGPQGGLGKGLSIRGQPSGSGVATASEIRRFGPASMAAYSGSGPGVERPVTPPEKPLLDRPATASGNPSRSLRQLERTLSDKAPVGNLHQQNQGLVSRPSTAPAYVPLTEDQLTQKSEAALLEYFSARDLKEAAQCVEDLRAPKFHPMMVCIWVMRSFDKKDPDRKLLVKLLISLQKSEPFLLKQEQVVQGFQLVLESLEDCVLDTPKAPDYIAELLVSLISAKALALDQTGYLLKQSEVLQSQFGLEILGKVLAGLYEESGERVLVDMFRSSGMRLEEFIINGKSGNMSLQEFLEEYGLQCLGPEVDSGSSTNNMQQLGAQLLEHLRKNEPIVETVRWLEKNVDVRTQLESSFLQMLMTQVLKHLIPAGSFQKDYEEEVLKEQLGYYQSLLRKFATDKEKQHHYIIAMQLYVHDIGHPAGLMTTLFKSLYYQEVISESAFYKWQDNVGDTTLGRDKALRDVYRWLQRLKTAPEQSLDDEF